MQDLYSHEYFMKEALKEAQLAFEAEEVPIGAIVVSGNKIIARAHNLTERLTDVTAHAEMQAITAAANYLGSKFLNDCKLYVTVEPCAMCAGAIYWARFGTLVFGTKDEKRGYHVFSNAMLHPKTELIQGVMEEECKTLMQVFFQARRS